ncbi:MULTISPECIES: hypothetical protein [unclassified Moorena]|uniref:hypothetical protein n=1 Tax=unclassified Moorena TaxID=2683338 RepID=UPI0013F7BFFA|nr:MULTISPECIES: hypothetical protein [unclassified Moorena]NEO44570.1 hypothetical protein [Moorena sp. SIO4A3]NEO12272.1 hypothetical protein [Moorena sp. SIO3E8]NEP26500.1 hypothetical protein [Moorena sp. SIO3I6]NEP98915.1 hypothetical protein [Moorena sp. SIO3F7]NEQ63866.1 hypothetical protein [Moorena sp. SIO4A1]
MKILYNTETKKLEAEFNWKIFILPFSTYQAALGLVKYVVDLVKSPGNIFKNDNEIIQNDSEIIRSIIEEGRKQNVDEMEIEMSRDAAAGINVDGIQGVDVTFGSKGKINYVMKIKYKSDD